MLLCSPLHNITYRWMICIQRRWVCRTHVSCLQSVVRCAHWIRCHELTSRSPVSCSVQLLGSSYNASNCIKQINDERGERSSHCIRSSHRITDCKQLTWAPMGYSYLWTLRCPWISFLRVSSQLCRWRRIFWYLGKRSVCRQISSYDLDLNLSL